MSAGSDPASRSRRHRQGRLAGWRNPQLWRLGSGLVLFAFALTHFLNHAVGHISLDAMESVQAVRRLAWRSWPGTLLLYGAVAVHVGLVLWKLISRRTWRMARWEALQIGLGLSIPVLAVAHVVGTRGLNALYGFDDTYRVVLRLLWPGPALSQSLLLIVVWLHAMIGLHHWLRTKAWYSDWSPVLLVLAVLVPTLALTGWIEAARRLVAVSSGPAPVSAELLEAGRELIEKARMLVWTAFGLAIAALVGWRLIDWMRGGPPITYSGGRVVRAPSGATLLEISRSAGVPHAAVCGGRGRCTTCRVLVLDGGQALPPPNATEAAALARIGAPAGVRLACQVRPEVPLKVRPLVALRDSEPAVGHDAFRWGVERRITVMFSDLRAFTTLAERLYPYDSVFLLNRYFEVMQEAIERHGGAVDKFLGDGIMALFGVAPARGSGSRDAVLAARDMLDGLDHLNEEFHATLSARLRMGLGIHTGPAVLGRVGAGRQAGLTAMGDSVNIASRLEALNKEFSSDLVVSDATLQASGFLIQGAEARRVRLRGRDERLTVHVLAGKPVLVEPPRLAAAAAQAEPRRP